jgi:hypothetical protein
MPPSLPPCGERVAYGGARAQGSGSQRRAATRPSTYSLNCVHLGDGLDSLLREVSGNLGGLDLHRPLQPFCAGRGCVYWACAVSVVCRS